MRQKSWLSQTQKGTTSTGHRSLIGYFNHPPSATPTRKAMTEVTFEVEPIAAKAYYVGSPTVLSLHSNHWIDTKSMSSNFHVAQSYIMQATMRTFDSELMRRARSTGVTGCHGSVTVLPANEATPPFQGISQNGRCDRLTDATVCSIT